MEPYFQLDDVWVTGNRGGDSRPILSEISLEIRAGERWTVVGRSGAGKTTLLRLFNRMVEPSSGVVRSEGVPLPEIDPSQLRRRVGMVFQEPIWLPGTVKDNLLAAASLKLVSPDTAETRMEEILALIGLGSPFLTRKEDELSVGERQRVALGRALMTRPRALLLDEPTASLDPPGAKSLLEQVLSLSEAEGLTMIMVTHRLRDARLFGATTVVVDEGRVAEMGPSKEVVSRLEDRWEEGDS